MDYDILKTGEMMNKKIFEYSYTLKKEKQHRDFMLCFYIVAAVCVIALTFHLIIFPVRQQSSSMQPEITDKSVLMVTPLVKTPSRGDVVMLKPEAPARCNIFKKIAASVVSFFTARQVSILEDKNLPGTSSQLRRVIGLPGDTVYISDFIAHVKPSGDKYFLTEFEYADKTYNLDISVLPENWDSSTSISNSTEEITLGPDEYFVLCDNRNNFNDSRLWGPVSQEQFKGKVLFCYFPFSNLKLF